MMNILMLAPLPPPSGGIASWTIRYRDYCESNSIPLRIVNIAMQGERAESETMTKSLRTELQSRRHLPATKLFAREFSITGIIPKT